MRNNPHFFRIISHAPDPFCASAGGAAFMPLQLDAGLLHHSRQHFSAVGLSSFPSLNEQPSPLNHIISGKSTTYDDRSGKTWEEVGKITRRTGKRREARAVEAGKGGSNPPQEVSTALLTFPLPPSTLNPQPTTHNTIYQRTKAASRNGKRPNRKWLATSNVCTLSHQSPKSSAEH